MNNQLSVAVLQVDLHWEGPKANLELFDKKIDELKDNADIIVLPEMFTSGFTMNASKVAESMDGKTISWIKAKAKSSNATIIGSIVISENEKFYNRLICAEPNGNITTYDKKHTFTLAGEHKVYDAGKDKIIFNYKGWKICPLVCYDLRFPVWSRNVEDYDVLIYVANWPKVRIDAWDTLLKARAIENMSYCIGVNRVGFDGNNHEYSGHSAVYDVLGKRIDALPKEKEATEIVTVSKDHIDKYRKKLNFLNDRDTFTLEA